MTPVTETHPESRSSLQIEEDIRQRRDKMDSTIDELGSRLTLRSLVNTAIEWWDEPPTGSQGSVAARKAGKGLARQIKQHPLPSLLIASGIAWLISDATGDDEDAPKRATYPRGPLDGSPDEGSRIKDTLHQAKDSAGGAMDSAKSKASEFGHRVHDSGSELAHKAMDRSKSAARRVGHELAHGYQVGGEQVSRAVENYPLAVGVACAAFGSLVGLAIPHSRKEDEWMGERSDHLKETAKDKGEDLLESGKAVGERVVAAATEEAREQGLTPAKATGALGDLVEKGSQVMDKAKAEAGQAAKEEGLAPK